MNEAIIVSNINKTFKTKKERKKTVSGKTKNGCFQAVKDLSFSVNEGEVYGLLGPNGAGKTTTLRMLSTLIKPDHGSIRILDYDVQKNPYEVRRAIGFSTGEMKLDRNLTPNYLYDFFSNIYGVEKNIASERKNRLFQQFEIESYANEKIDNLSTGMKQKVALVITLVNDPEILILDEPTNGMDILTAKIVMDFIYDLKKQGKTILISTHIFSLVEKLCDRVGIIIDGSMVYEEQLENILETGDMESQFFSVFEGIKHENRGI